MANEARGVKDSICGKRDMQGAPIAKSNCQKFSEASGMVREHPKKITRKNSHAPCSPCRPTLESYSVFATMQSGKSVFHS